MVFQGPARELRRSTPGKIDLVPNGAVSHPGLFDIEITEEKQTYYRARILGEAAMMDLPENGESGSVRLQLAVEAFGAFEERASITREDQDPIIRVFWTGISQQQFDREIERRVSLRKKNMGSTPQGRNRYPAPSPSYPSR